MKTDTGSETRKHSVLIAHEIQRKIIKEKHRKKLPLFLVNISYDKSLFIIFQFVSN